LQLIHDGERLFDHLQVGVLGGVEATASGADTPLDRASALNDVHQRFESLGEHGPVERQVVTLRSYRERARELCGNFEREVAARLVLRVPDDEDAVAVMHPQGLALKRRFGLPREDHDADLAAPVEHCPERAPSCFEPYRVYLEARFVDDAHVRASVLFEELVPLGFDRSYPTLVREIWELGLRPVCDCCKAGGVRVTVGLEHEPGEELQLDWLELSETPWGEKAYVLVGALSHSGRGRPRGDSI
jgi:hypothetical protein